MFFALLHAVDFVEFVGSWWKGGFSFGKKLEGKCRLSLYAFWQVD